MKFKDQLNRTFSLTKTPTRIVSLVPSQTELLCDLGLEDAIVGVTKFCVHPDNIRKSKAIVGGTKQVKIDKVKALQPDIILCNKEENSKEIINALTDVAPIHISDIYTIADCIQLILMYAELFNSSERAHILIEKLNCNLEDFKTFVLNKPITPTAYFIWKNPWMIAAKNTFIDHVMALHNFDNVYGNQMRYPEISLYDDELKKADLILLSSEPFPFKEKHILELRRKFPHAEIKLVDGEYFSWYGSRLVHAFDYFKTLHQAVE